MHILEVGTSHDLEVLFTTAWSLWYNRNQVVHESNGIPSSQIWGYAQRLLCNYKGATIASFLSQQPPDVGLAAPPPGMYKINVDGATSEDERLPSVGVVIRDCRGAVVATRGKLLPATYSVEVTEALALEEGIMLARELHLQQIIIESDSITVVQEVNSSSFNGEMGTIIQGAFTMLTSFSSWRVNHLKREYNNVAHEVAQVTRSTETSRTWIGVDPPWLHNLLLVDRSKC